MARGEIGVPPQILQEAAKPILERIRADAAMVSPVPVGTLLGYIADHLFAEGLTIRSAKAATGVRGNRVVELCQLELRCSPRRYLEDRRAEVAERLRKLAPELSLEQIAEAIGVGSAAALTAKLNRHRLLLEHAPAAPEAAPTGIAEGGPVEELLKITKPPAEQEAFEVNFARQATLKYQLALPRHARRYRQPMLRFRGPALFRTALRFSREGCRDDRKLGVEVAELALEGLRRQRLRMAGEEFALLEIEGLVTLGMTQRLAGDLLGARETLGDVKAALAERTVPESVLAEALHFEGLLLAFERDFEKAIIVLSRACELRSKLDESVPLIRTLLCRGFVHEGRGGVELARADYDRALGLVVQTGDCYLGAAVATRLASVAASAGDWETAEQCLAAARELAAKVSCRSIWYRLWWIEGLMAQIRPDARRAEECLMAARVGFRSAGDWGNAAAVALDLAILYSENDRLAEVPALVAEVLPVAEAFKLLPDQLEAMRLLQRALVDGRVSRELLVRIRAQLAPRTGAPSRGEGGGETEARQTQPR